MIQLKYPRKERSTEILRTTNGELEDRDISEGYGSQVIVTGGQLEMKAKIAKSGRFHGKAEVRICGKKR